MRPDSGFDVNTRTYTVQCAQTVVLVLIHVHAPRQWFWTYMRPDSGFDVNTRTYMVLVLIHLHAP